MATNGFDNDNNGDETENMFQNWTNTSSSSSKYSSHLYEVNVDAIRSTKIQVERKKRKNNKNKMSKEAIHSDKIDIFILVASILIAYYDGRHTMVVGTYLQT